MKQLIDVNPNVAARFCFEQTLKSAFKNEGPIDGSWIVMKTEPFKNNVITMDVYRGGISTH